MGGMQGAAQSLSMDQMFRKEAMQDGMAEVPARPIDAAEKQ